MATKRLPRWTVYIILVLACAFLVKLASPVFSFEFEEHKQIQGTWLGSYMKYYDQKVPFPVIFDFQPDGQLIHQELGSDEKLTSKWIVHDHKLLIDSFDFQLIDVNDDSLSYSTGSKRVLRRISSKLPGKSIAEFQQILKNSIWVDRSSNHQFMVFSDSTIDLYSGHEKESRCWKLFKFKEAVFLYQMPLTDCKGGKGRVSQVLELNTQRLITLSQNEKENKKTIYSKLEVLPDSISMYNENFRRCYFNGIPNHLSISDANALGGRDIQDHFFENFECAESWKGMSGYLRLKFIINCKGQAGAFNWQTMDKSFTHMDFPDSLKNHLLYLFSSIKGWQPLERDDQLLDAWKSIIFKIEDGNLVSVSP